MRAFLRPSVVLIVVGAVAVFGLTVAGASVRGADDNGAVGSSVGVWGADAVPGELIVGFTASSAVGNERNTAIAIAGARLDRHLIVPGFSLVQVPPGEEADHAAKLLASANVASVEPNLIVKSLLTPDDEFYSRQWHLTQIGMEEAWDKASGEGVTVAVIDGGVAYEDCPSLTCGADYRKAPDFGSTNFVFPADMVDDDAHANDVDGHGTFVASIIASATNNGIGGSGIAHDADIMPIRVLDTDGTDTIADSVDGIIWATDNGADVINLSLGHPSPAAVEEAAVQYALDNDVVVVASTGNGGEDGFGDATILCPACYVGVIGVGATTVVQTRTLYSNYGPSPDEIPWAIILSAPGGDIFDFDPVWQQSYTHFCTADALSFSAFSFCPAYGGGTSFAAPHVAGVAALIRSIDPTLNRFEVWGILTDTASDLGAPGYDGFFGFGEVDAAAAVVAAQESLEPGQKPEMALIVKSGGFCAEDVCTVVAGEAFNLNVEIVAAPADGYILVQSWIDFGSDLVYKPTDDPTGADELVWDDNGCTVAVRVQFGATAVGHGCLTGIIPPLPVSNFVGTLVSLAFNCSEGDSSTEVPLLPVGDPVALADGAEFKDPANNSIAPKTTNVTVNCVVPPTATPTPENSPTSTSTPGPTDTPSAPTPTPILLSTVAPATPVPMSTPTWTPTAPPTATPTNTRTPTPTILVGDASCDGVVNPLDAALILQLAAGIIPALPCPSGGDVNGDGTTNALDAALILQFSAGLLNSLPP